MSSAQGSLKVNAVFEVVTFSPLNCHWMLGQGLESNCTLRTRSVVLNGKTRTVPSILSATAKALVEVRGSIVGVSKLIKYLVKERCKRNKNEYFDTVK